MIPTTAFEALATLVEYAFVGRILLSILPPGFPGLHSFRDLPATWAASHLLGSVSLALELRLLETLDLAPHPLSAADRRSASLGCAAAIVARQPSRSSPFPAALSSVRARRSSAQ